MEAKDFGHAAILALGHLLGSDFDWISTMVLSAAWLVGCYIISKYMLLYKRYILNKK